MENNASATVPPLVIRLGHHREATRGDGGVGNDLTSVNTTAVSEAHQAVRSTRTALDVAQGERMHWRARQEVRRWREAFLSFLYARYANAGKTAAVATRALCTNAAELCAAVTTATGDALNDDRVNWYCHQRPAEAACLFFVRALTVDRDWRNHMAHVHAARAADQLDQVRCSHASVVHNAHDSIGSAASALHATLDSVIDEWNLGTTTAPHYSLRALWRASVARNTDSAANVQGGSEAMLRATMHASIDTFVRALYSVLAAPDTLASSRHKSQRRRRRRRRVR